MKMITVDWHGRSYAKCRLYEPSDEPRILEVFSLWKVAVILSERTATKNPQLPQTFSEPFVSLLCGLAHNSGTGPDAFRLDPQLRATAVEIKATITPVGFTDIKRDLEFDELIWLDMHQYEVLSFDLYSLGRHEFEAAVAASRTARDRGTIGMRRIAVGLGRGPFLRGRVGWQLRHEGA
jgi:hypothetical protein